MGRFLPPKIQRRAIQIKTTIFRYIRFLFLSPSNLYRYFYLLKTPPTPFLDLELPRKKNLKIACIFDEFTFESFRHEANFFQLSPKSWKKQMMDSKPDFVMVESAWKGESLLWKKKISEISNEIIGLLYYAHRNNIPTIFWHKEVPPHFKTFMHVSRLFDRVFLTDEDCVEAYKKKVGHNFVYTLPFACQPKIHNPIETKERKKAVLYAGTYYPEYKYPERNKDFHRLYKAISSILPIDIYDRNASTGLFPFPEDFQQSIRGSLPFAEISNIYRQYEYGLNLNSVKNSSTMCSRRVFELIASNTVVVGNSSKSVQRFFGNYTISSDDENELHQRVQELENNKNLKESAKRKALRCVFKDHTYDKRLQTITCLLDKKQRRSAHQVLLVSFCKTEEEIHKAIRSFQAQTYEYKAILLATENTKNDKDGQTIFTPQNQFLSTLNEVISRYAYVGIIDPRQEYGKYHIEDLVIGMKSGSYAGATSSPTRHYREIDSLALHSSIAHVDEVDLTTLSLDTIISGNILSCPRQPETT